MVSGGDLVLPGRQLLDGVEGQEGQVGTTRRVRVAPERKTQVGRRRVIRFFSGRYGLVRKQDTIRRRVWIPVRLQQSFEVSERGQSLSHDRMMSI